MRPWPARCPRRSACAGASPPPRPPSRGPRTSPAPSSLDCSPQRCGRSRAWRQPPPTCRPPAAPATTSRSSATSTTSSAPHGDNYAAVLGDVCGKGVKAAQLSSMARYTVRADAADTGSPAELLNRLNTAMLAQSAERFLTAVYAAFHLTPSGAAGTLTLAGHPPALLRRADGQVRQLGKTGMLLGVRPAVDLTDVPFELAPGDLLLLYTDGAIEGRPRPGTDGAAALFGETELARALADSHPLDAGATVDHLTAVLHAHHHGWASDDTALLALRVPPAHG
ncbi:PP2C family protein-serine/threonine phosphatase [Streptomyces sp. NPDC060194]|uniref:PP2C family protein-serine/threonine phosphatase n=1 Tax=Streptomyces sp. NPDC060194 TaxID=3347069 RepID=UPI0036671E17